MFTPSDRLAATFKGLRGKLPAVRGGHRRDGPGDPAKALLEADVSLPVVRTFTSGCVSGTTGPGVDQPQPGATSRQDRSRELIEILGEVEPATEAGEKSRPPGWSSLCTGLQGAGKTDAGRQTRQTLRTKGHQPVLVAADLQR